MSRVLIRSVWLLIALLLLLPGAGARAAGNLLINGDFEVSKNGLPEGWETEAWLKDEGLTVFGWDQQGAFEGSGVAFITNTGDNHARFIQKVKVKGNQLYRFSGYVRTEGVGSHGTGAHLSVEGAALTYPNVTDTGGEWSFLEFYGKTAKNQREIEVGISLGGYGGINSGTSWFDSVSVEEVSKAPEGAEVLPLAPTSIDGGDSGEKEAAPKVSILSTMIYAVLFTLLFVWVNRSFIRGGALAAGERSRNLAPVLLALGLGLGLALRIVIGLTNEGYVNDIALFTYWSDHAVSHGLANFYHTDIFVDYPPGYIYILYALGVVKGWLGIDNGTTAALLLYKLPAILADLAAAAVLYRVSRSKLGNLAGAGIALLYIFNPAAIYDSAAWGQVDAIFALALCLAVCGMAERRFGYASIWFAIAALIKPQAFIFMPVLLLALALNRKWKPWLLSAGYGFTTFLLLATPFFWKTGGLASLIKLYSGTLSSYPYATLNAFNFYALQNANWKPLGESFLFIPYQVWGGLFIACAVALSVYFALVSLRRNGGNQDDRSFFIALILIAVVFIFVTKMHERYMFPALLLSLFAYIQSSDRRMLGIFYGFTITNFINMSYVLLFSKFTTNVPMDGIVILCSAANIGLLLYAIYIGYDRYKRGNILRSEMIKPEDRQAEDRRLLDAALGVKEGNGMGAAGGAVLTSRKRRNPLSKKEWLWMGGITLVYAAVALFNLGAMKGPVTPWQPASGGESFYVDLGENKQLERITSFGGVGTGKYRLEFAPDNGDWFNPIEVDNSHVAVFSWRSEKLELTARYVKLTVTQAGFSMHEMAFYEKGSKEPLPVIGINEDEAGTPRRGSLQNLFDEQELMIYNQNFRNGSYFDEIYHARTAYENLEGIVAYENTHPPLGKIIIALGIKLFGLNPFGWRIAGTVIGIAMLPIMYMMARRLFGKPLYAALATILFAADFMHFTQTRISTIDVYGVFFIMLMFYFMHKYVSMNFYRDKLAATLVPLGLAGLFFGLGVASKWIVLYGGAGLAIMLLLSLIDRWKEYAAAKRAIKAGQYDERNESALRNMLKHFPRNTVATLLSCLIFYIAIPAGIYALSYIPILSVMKDGYTWQALVDYQKNMFNYHSNLVSSHPFASSWWEWPFMKRPVWYYSGSELAEGMKSTIVAMGNPLIWWTGIFAMLLTIYVSVKRRDKGIYMLWIAFLAQYVPWMLVTRETFLYHYFAMVPFVILSIIYIFKHMEEQKPWFHKVRKGYIIAAVALFVLFYPALSGLTVPKAYVDILLRWFPSWVF
ncbi:phospholipid carrier-dependent glycosyltransferase [Paenibacillus oryzae]|uniref:phospholipid carrier-dependent glycosyltransferase n=1 Tax=Paenibacillus oryzae TaxID=1844972 RepID=UPI0009EE87A1|nr:phospholipid carrier-dependent glycosyltransferase [Paenibacillus oryzae]